jgi:hypothetical protein
MQERGWLFDRQLRAETFELIEAALPSASGDVADGLVGDVIDQIDDDQP